jgi:hypothetical protein
MNIRRRERLAFWLTFHVPALYRLRSWWRDRQGRPGFRAWDR